MTDSYQILNYIPSVLYLLGEIILLIASFMLFTKQRSTATVFMVIASLGAIIFSTLSFFSFMFADITDYNTSFNISMVLSMLGGFCNILFAIGLGLFAMKYFSKPK